MAELPNVAEWVALLDVVDRLIHAEHAYDERVSVVAQAIERLYVYEHTMTPVLRQLSREQVWMRDFPDTPLPAERGWWELCQCRTCAIKRRLERARRQPTAYEVQHAVLTRQRRSYP